VIENKWGPEYKVFSHENGLNFSKKDGIFPKIGVSPKKALHFLRGLLMQRILELSPNLPLIKKK